MRVLAGIAAAVALLVAPADAVARAALPVGEAKGVRIVRERGAIVVVFTKEAAKLYQRIAGRLVYVECIDQHPLAEPPRAYTFIGPGGPGAIREEASGGVTMRAPKRRRKLVTGDMTRGLDLCRLRRGRRVIVSVPLTQDGAVFLDEQAKARRLMRLLLVAGLAGERLNLSGWPSHAQLVRELKLTARHRIVELASPADSPPAGSLGYYSDRREHAAVVALSKSGRRLFIELAGDVVSTNVAGHVFAGS